MRIPLLVVPPAAEGQDDRVERCEDLAPAGKPAQADSGQVVLLVVESGSELRDLLPGRLLGHGQPSSVEEVLAVHQERRLAVERHGVEAVLETQRLADRRDEVVGIVVALTRVVVEIGDPPVASPDRNLVRTDGHNVVLARLGGDVLGNFVAQLVLGQDREVDRDVRILLLEVADQFFHVLHLRVGNRGNGDRGCLAFAAPFASSPPSPPPPPAPAHAEVTRRAASPATGRPRRQLWLEVDAMETSGHVG